VYDEHQESTTQDYTAGGYRHSANDTRDQELLKALRLFDPPAILFFGADGEENRQHHVVGYMNAEQFRSYVDSAFGSRT